MNKQYLPFFAVILIAVLIITPGIAGADSKIIARSTGYSNVTASKAHKMIEEEDVFILDVRTPVEYNYSAY